MLFNEPSVAVGVAPSAARVEVSDVHRARLTPATGGVLKTEDPDACGGPGPPARARRCYEAAPDCVGLLF